MGLCRCVVQGCKSKSNTNVIFSIPKIRKYDADITCRRRLLWLKRLNLPDKDVSKTGVCDQHFISGKPSHYIEESNPDWAPTQNIGSKNLVPKSALDRYNRRNKFHNMKGNRTRGLKKKNGSRDVDLDLPSVSGFSGNSSLDKKKLKIAGKITHQIPGVLKKPKELKEIENENQLDVFWMHKLPIKKNSSQISYAKVIKLGETNNSNVVTQPLKLNVQQPLFPVKKVGCPKGGVDPKQKHGESNRRPMVIVPVATLEQVMRNPCEDSLLFISNNATNDHNYCAKPAAGIKKGHHIYMDHNYCQPFHSNGSKRLIESSPTPENMSEFTTDTSMQNPLELTDEEIHEYADQVYQKKMRHASRTNSMYDVILSDDKECSTCDEVAHLKSELEKKSLALESGMNGVNSLKQELELAKQHISNLRAQLEQNTRTLWSYCR